MVQPCQAAGHWCCLELHRLLCRRAQRVWKLHEPGIFKILYIEVVCGRLLSAPSCVRATPEGMQDHERLFIKAVHQLTEVHPQDQQKNPKQFLQGVGVELLSLQLSTVPGGESRLPVLLPWSRS